MNNVNRITIEDIEKEFSESMKNSEGLCATTCLEEDGTFTAVVLEIRKGKIVNQMGAKGFKDEKMALDVATWKIEAITNELIDAGLIDNVDLNFTEKNIKGNEGLVH